MPLEDQVAVGGSSADEAELNPQASGEFSDDEGDIGIPITGSTDGNLSKDPLLSDKPSIDADKEKENSRRALCWSVLAMAMSIPALIGA